MMKHVVAALAVAFLAASAAAQTEVIQVTRHAGAGTGQALQFYYPTEPGDPIQRCLADVGATKMSPTTYATCKVRARPAAAPVVCQPASAPTTVTTSAACPTGTTGGPLVTTVTTTYTRGAPPACAQTVVAGQPVTTGTCTPIVVTPPPTGTVLYFSDCQPGAAAGCAAGNDSFPGTSPSAPKRTLGGVNLNALPAGSAIRFAAGGAWTGFSMFLQNRNVTAASPLTFEAYGTGPKPALQTPNGTAVFFDTYGSTVIDGGYVFRGLKFDGMGTGQWGLFIQGGTRGVLVEDNELTGFEIAIHAQNGAGLNAGLVIRRNNLHHNREMGMLGDANDLVFEDNVVESNNFSGSGFNHGLYLGGHATNGIVRRNRFVNNSTVNGVCLGGNLTVHGQWDGLLVEGNTISQVQAGPGCYGISINDGYNSAEFFRNVIVRGNQVENMDCALCIRASPGIVIEANRIRGDRPEYQAAIVITPPTEAQDDQGPNPVLRDNVICAESAPTATQIRITVPGAVQTGTVIRSGADATTGACAR
jgi:hypothetical protein